MHKARRLNDLGRRCGDRADRLREASVLLHPPLSSPERVVASFVVVEALTLWANFARSYYLSCALGTKSPDGGRVQLGIPLLPDEQSALQFAASRERNKSRGEPIWHDFNAFGRAMNALQLADQTRLTAGLAYSPRVFTDLPPCRNFFAHRSRGTASKVKTVARRNGINPNLPASDVVCSHPSGRAQPLVVDWLDDLTAIVEILSVP